MKNAVRLKGLRIEAIEEGAVAFRRCARASEENIGAFLDHRRVPVCEQAHKWLARILVTFLSAHVPDEARFRGFRNQVRSHKRLRSVSRRMAKSPRSPQKRPAKRYSVRANSAGWSVKGALSHITLSRFGTFARGFPSSRASTHTKVAGAAACH